MPFNVLGGGKGIQLAKYYQNCNIPDSIDSSLVQINPGREAASWTMPSDAPITRIRHGVVSIISLLEPILAIQTPHLGALNMIMVQSKIETIKRTLSPLSHATYLITQNMGVYRGEGGEYLRRRPDVPPYA